MTAIKTSLSHLYTVFALMMRRDEPIDAADEILDENINGKSVKSMLIVHRNVCHKEYEKEKTYLRIPKNVVIKWSTLYTLLVIFFVGAIHIGFENLPEFSSMLEDIRNGKST